VCSAIPTVTDFAFVGGPDLHAEKYKYVVDGGMVWGEGRRRKGVTPMRVLPKFGAIFTLGAIAITSSGFEVHAATSGTDARLAYYTVRLQKQANHRTVFAAVRVLSVKLVQLDPNGATRYYKIALRKLELDPDRSARLKSVLSRILANSDLSPSRLRQILLNIRREQLKYMPPEPTPTPYQAMLMIGRDGAA